MSWTNAVIMEFLDLYEKEAVIWNPQLQGHSDRTNVHSAWIRIQNRLSIECSLKDLKRKKENLMATYRKLALRVKKIGKTGRANVDRKPVWFAYEKIDSFMHKVYTPRGFMANESEIHDNDDGDIETNYDDEILRIIKPEDNISSTASSTNENEDDESSSVSKGGSPLCKKRKHEQMENNEEGISDSYSLWNLPGMKVAYKPKQSKNETELFCDLLCMKLQALDDDTREIAMHEINNLMFSYRKSRVQTN